MSEAFPNGIFCSLIDPGIHGVLIPLLFCASFIAFMWGVFFYALHGEYDEYAREMSKGLMLWSIFAFLFMAAVWGIVEWIYGAVGVGSAIKTYASDIHR
jgi:hypothetical protein